MKASNKTILIISGSFLSIDIWNPWKEYFEYQGYDVTVPPWPYKSGTTAELTSRHPDDNQPLALLTLAELVEYYANIARRMPEKPIVIGHSMGGLIAQILVNRRHAAAGVAIHSFPPRGVIPYELSFYRAGWKALGLLTSRRKTYLMSFQDWQYAFVNGMPLESQKEAYAKFLIPESKTVSRGAIGAAAEIDFKRKHAPLLFTAGSTDNIIPASLNRRNFEKYHANGSTIDFKEFSGHNHFVPGQPQWKEEASYISSWIAQNVNG